MMCDEDVRRSGWVDEKKGKIDFRAQDGFK